jgi:transposase-like protein
MTRKRRFQNAGAGKGVKHRLDRETLHRLYIEEGLTQTEIAKRYDCTPQFVSLLVREYGLRANSPTRVPRPDT